MADDCLQPRARAWLAWNGSMVWTDHCGAWQSVALRIAPRHVIALRIAPRQAFFRVEVLVQVCWRRAAALPRMLGHLFDLLLGPLLMSVSRLVQRRFVGARAGGGVLVVEGRRKLLKALCLLVRVGPQRCEVELAEVLSPGWEFGWKRAKSEDRTLTTTLAQQYWFCWCRTAALTSKRAPR